MIDDEPSDLSLFSQCDEKAPAEPEEGSDADAGQAPAPDALEPGTRLGDYEVESVLGNGGCGVVYLGRHEPSRRKVAIKVLHGHLTTAPKVVTRFLREVEMIERLHHPNIVAVESTGTHEDGRPYYVMEYLGPATLTSICREQGRLTASECLQILEPVCSALAAAHEAGIVHRDIKASNISVKHDGDTYVVKLLDFGVAKLGRSEVDGSGFTTRGRVVGSLYTMAPEQLRGLDIDARADIYALGALMYRMLTGKMLFYSTQTVEVVWRHIEEPAPRPSLSCYVSPGIDAVVLRCLEKDPARRFQSVQSFLEALRLAVEEQTPEEMQSRGHTITAVGIYVELRPRADAGEMDEAQEDDTQEALDSAEQALADAGFSMAIATGNALLGVRELPSEGATRQREERRAEVLAESLREELSMKMVEHGQVEAIVLFRVDHVIVEQSEEIRFLGGPLLHTEDWVTSDDTHTLSVPPTDADHGSSAA